MKCETCGNDYPNAFEIVMDGKSHYFDSFECAIHALAPKCAHCGCKILGHGSEANDVLYCCAHCARQSGASGIVDNA
jgi:Rieske Fe-S protein